MKISELNRFALATVEALREVAEKVGTTKFPHPYPPWDWYISLHLVDFYGINVGKYTTPMDPMGQGVTIFSAVISGGGLVDFSKLVM